MMRDIMLGCKLYVLDWGKVKQGVDFSLPLHPISNHIISVSSVDLHSAITPHFHVHISLSFDFFICTLYTFPYTRATTPNI